MSNSNAKSGKEAKLDDHKKRKRQCGCTGEYVCDACDGEFQPEEESRGKQKKKHKSARMTVSKKSDRKAGPESDAETGEDSDVELVQQRQSEAVRELEKERRRTQQLQKDLAETQKKAAETEAKLLASKEERKQLEKDKEKLQESVDEALRLKGMKKPECSICTDPVNPSTMATLRCGHSFCAVPCLQNMLRSRLVIARGDFLPANIEVKSMHVVCPLCRADSGVSFTTGSEHLSFPSIQVVEATGFPYIAPKLECKCAEVGKSAHAIMLHQVLCPEVPLLCPYFNQLSPCHVTIKCSGNSLRAVGEALRSHFEEDCTHQVHFLPGAPKSEIRTVRLQLRRVRDKLDIAAILHYEFVTFADVWTTPTLADAAALTVKAGTFQPDFRGKTWQQLLDMLLTPGNRHSLNDTAKKTFFSHRFQLCFSDAALADPQEGAMVKVRNQLPWEEEEENEMDDDIPDVKEAPAPAPAQAQPQPQQQQQQINNGNVQVPGQAPGQLLPRQQINNGNVQVPGQAPGQLLPRQQQNGVGVQINNGVVRVPGQLLQQLNNGRARLNLPPVNPQPVNLAPLPVHLQMPAPAPAGADAPMPQAPANQGQVLPPAGDQLPQPMLDVDREELLRELLGEHELDNDGWLRRGAVRI